MTTNNLLSNSQQLSPENVQFGHWIKQQLSREMGTTAGIVPILTSQEHSLITERLLQDNTEIEAACVQRLSVGREFYVRVKQDLLAILQAWDAVIDEKDAFDRTERLMGDRQSIESLLICTDIVPRRVNIGSLGPPDLLEAMPGIPSVHSGEQLVLNVNHEDSCGNVVQALEHMRRSDSQHNHAADYLALSDYEVDDVTEEEEEDEDEDNHRQNFGNVESDEDEEKCHNELSKDMLRPPTPWPRSIADELGIWDTDLEKLLHEPRSEVEEELSDMEDFTTPEERRASNPPDLLVWTDETFSWNSPEEILTPINKTKQRHTPKETAGRKKRSLSLLCDNGSEALGEGHPRPKRLRR